jgi:hypothetical protein
MTIGSLKCVRCNKINCKKFYKCVNCDILCCKECLDETNPMRLIYKVLKNDENGIEKTIYCPLHCSKIYNYCNDCGGHFNNLNRCSCCLINFCSDCHDRNTGSLTEFMLPNNYEYNTQIISISMFYCSKSCLKINYLYESDIQTVCHKCGDCFYDIYNHEECSKCLNLSKLDGDISHDKKRFILQQKIIKIIYRKEILEKEIESKIEEYMKEEIIENVYTNENKITLRYWLYDLESGSTNSMVMMDNCITKILNEFSIVHKESKYPGMLIL